MDKKNSTADAYDAQAAQLRYKARTQKRANELYEKYYIESTQQQILRGSAGLYDAWEHPPVYHQPKHIQLAIGEALFETDLL